MPSIVDRFPKHRDDLPEAYKRIYERHYLLNREGKYQSTSLSRKLEAWMHRKVAADVRHGPDAATLEIGAGTLNQLPYEASVSRYDIVEPFRALFEGSDALKRVRHQYADVSDAYASAPYDRITSVAVFEHITDLPMVVAHAALLLRDGGHLRVAIPNEGTVMWRLGTMVTGREFRKIYGLDYQVLMKYEHVNTADEIEAVLKAFFASTDRSVFGITKWLGFYRFYDCTGANKEAARLFLQRRGLRPST
jgi:SAM-dependent methyltransferase